MTDPVLEAEVRRRLDAGQVAAAVAAVVEVYGPEVFGFLRGMLRSDDDAEEAFAETCAHLCRDLPHFRWESLLRTWLYMVARRRGYAVQEARARRGGQVALSQAPEVTGLVAQVRTRTRTFQRTEVKAQVAALRDQLEPDDRALLILRVDRDLAWREVAAILGVTEPAARKRFERVKGRLRELVARSAQATG